MDTSLSSNVIDTSEQVEFCERCGSVLPLPSFLDESRFVLCPICSLQVEATLFNGLSTFTRVSFNERELAARKATKAIDAEGPVVERLCARCGHDKQSFATLQTRSADEGQTIFYTCLKCGAKENENS